MPGLLERIRERTQVLHARIEAAVPILGPVFSRDEYVTLLARFYGYYSGVQQVVRSGLAFSRSPVARIADERVRWLEADLAFFGYSTALIASLPVCWRVPELNTRESHLGAGYVFEGSALGGHIICRHLHRRWGLRPEAGATFFYGHGERTGEIWKGFTHSLYAESATLDENAVIESAIATFESVWMWLSENAQRNQPPERETEPLPSRAAPHTSLHEEIEIR